MIIDAIVLAGGRASRLDGASKAGLSLDGRSLLEHTLDALAVARRIVVVGDETDILAAAPDAAITIVRETPVFAGPAAAIAAGVDALGALGAASDFTGVVACDMPTVGSAIAVLVTAVRDGSDGSDGAVAVSPDGRVQPLVAVYSTVALAECVARHREAGDLENLSVRALLAGLDPALVSVPDSSTDDVDTWADAARLGVATPLRPVALQHPVALQLPVAPQHPVALQQKE
ncbi:MAG TPA: NTP transferase domain-containing protein [Galbitalea sp.]